MDLQWLVGLHDTYLVVAIWLVAVVSIFFGYVFGGYVWVERHSIRLTGSNKRVSGFWGEFMVVTLAVLLLRLTNQITPDAGLIDIVTMSGPLTLGVVATVFVLVQIYAVGIVRAARNEGHDTAYLRRLSAAYLPYNIYSTVAYSAGLLLLVTLVLQYVSDRANVVASGIEVENAIQQIAMQTTYDVEKYQLGIERIYLDVVLTGKLLSDQLTPVYMFVAALIGLNIIVKLTPVADAYLSVGQRFFQYLSVGAVGVVVLIALFTYYGPYAEIVDTASNFVIGLRDTMMSSDYQIASRYAEVVMDLEGRSGFLGFMDVVGNESGVFVAIALFFQWITDQFITKSN